MAEGLTSETPGEPTRRSSSTSGHVAALSAETITKFFGRTRVLTECTLEVNAGERVLLLGKNGAGKTTLMKICAGLLRPDSGAVRINGEPAKKEHCKVSYTGQDLHLYRDFTVEENVRLFWELRGQPERCSEQIARFGLTSHADKRISELSKGLQARASLAATLDLRAPVVLLDEPTGNLDDEGCEVLTSALQNCEPGASRPAILIATHDLSRLEKVATRGVLLHSGSVEFDSSRQEGDLKAVLKEYYRRNA